MDNNSKLLSLLVGVGLGFAPTEGITMDHERSERNFDFNIHESMQSLQTLDLETADALNNNSGCGNSGCGNGGCGGGGGSGGGGGGGGNGGCSISC